MKNQNYKTIVLHTVMPIIIGSLIYLLFRSKNILVFNNLKAIHLDILVDIWRSKFKIFKPYDWVVFCLPGGLWMYSYIYVIGLSWKNTIDRKNIIWYILPLFLAISSEFCQYFKFIRGTFDWQDVASYILFTVFALVFSKPKIELWGTLEQNNAI
jgi:hypothetical protein